MAKKSGSKSSRNERRAGRKRAERAREHGLPVRRDVPQRARASTPQPGSQRDGRDTEDRSSDAPLARAPKPAGIPTLVKVIGGALVILLGVYLLSRQRDEALTETKPAPELPAASATPPAPAPAPAPEPPPVAEPSAAAEPAAVPAVVDSPAAPAPVVSVTPPTKPVVVAPVVSTPVVPKVEKPHVAAPKPPAPAAVPQPPAPAAPVAPVAPAPAPAKPPDNPY